MVALCKSYPGDVWPQMGFAARSNANTYRAPAQFPSRFALDLPWFALLSFFGSVQKDMTCPNICRNCCRTPKSMTPSSRATTMLTFKFEDFRN